MKDNNTIHALRIPFKIRAASNLIIERFVYVYLIFGERIYLIDSGFAGSEKVIYEYIKTQDRKPEEIAAIILTHSHPDHIGSAKSIKRTTNCKIYVHEAEAVWVEDTNRQFKERPVPDFHNLVEGSVSVDGFLQDGGFANLEEDLSLEIIHTPGHSEGSVSILYKNESTLFTGDCLIAPGDLPIYENIADVAESIHKLQKIDDIEFLLSSWESPIQGRSNISRRMTESLKYLNQIHQLILRISGAGPVEPMELCKLVIESLGLPPAAVNPLVAKGFASNLAYSGKIL
ncbi:MAG: MBL fold metallo-hydrolase [Sedimentisphaerales bacterium]|nr:MBL fold metallo-hydrolase [Sedimentisphaerales bacterium]